jgi:hypothetical protein
VSAAGSPGHAGDRDDLAGRRGDRAVTGVAIVRVALTGVALTGVALTGVALMRSEGVVSTAAPQPSPRNSDFGDFAAYTTVNAPTTERPAT